MEMRIFFSFTRKKYFFAQDQFTIVKFYTFPDFTVYSATVWSRISSHFKFDLSLQQYCRSFLAYQLYHDWYGQKNSLGRAWVAKYPSDATTCKKKTLFLYL